MSKRTTDTKPTDAPKTPRAKAVKPAIEAAAAAPKAPRTRRKVSPPAEVATTNGASGKRPSHDEIATRAYYIALERGFSADPMADWLAAERELTRA